MEEPLRKVGRVWAGEGLSVYTANLADRLVLEWEDGGVCEVACRLQALLKRHALASSFVERLDGRSVLIRAVEPIPLTVVAESAQGETNLTFAGTNGEPLSPNQAARVDGMNRNRREMIEDVVTHAARSLRAHLTLHGVERLRLVMRFGVTSDGQCLAQVVNPLNCDLGTTDMEGLANLLGG